MYYVLYDTVKDLWYTYDNTEYLVEWATLNEYREYFLVDDILMDMFIQGKHEDVVPRHVLAFPIVPRDLDRTFHAQYNAEVLFDKGIYLTKLKLNNA